MSRWTTNTGLFRGLVVPEPEGEPAPPAVPAAPAPVPVQRDGKGRFAPGTARPARRRKGGKRGNTNASKTKNLARILLRRGLAVTRKLVDEGKVTPDALVILQQAPKYEAAAMDHIGPEPTFVEARHVANAGLAASIAAICKAQAFAEGPFVKPETGPSKLHPLLIEAAKFLELEGRSLAQLPKERRRAVPTLAAYLAARTEAQETAQETAQQAIEGPDGPDVEDVDDRPRAGKEGGSDVD